MITASTYGMTLIGSYGIPVSEGFGYLHRYTNCFLFFCGSSFYTNRYVLWDPYVGTIPHPNPFLTKNSFIVIPELAKWRTPPCVSWPTTDL